MKKTISRIRSWLRYNPPGALTSKGWRLFNQEFKEKAPVRYWIQNDLRDHLILPIKWKIQKIREWIRYRTYDRQHVLKTGLPPYYASVDHKMLHVNFNILKDFVEIEQAWQYYCWSSEWEERTALQKFFRTYHKYTFRRPDLGIKHFEWASTLDDPSLPLSERSEVQAIQAREILALYDWWVNKRPTRKDIELLNYKRQGVKGDLYALDDDFDHEADDYQKYINAVQQQQELDDERYTEDEEMLIRLIKIRKSLWT